MASPRSRHTSDPVTVTPFPLASILQYVVVRPWTIPKVRSLLHSRPRTPSRQRESSPGFCPSPIMHRNLPSVAAAPISASSIVPLGSPPSITMSLSRCCSDRDSPGQYESQLRRPC
ncbi:hypothetical protein DICSQDRAFT_151820 [Dichomitus squalens LYAD-421 SS1]|uniref:uncharacterized protein n=1 Tax=Dichomitus squalens (strain LYAD-421) TaxID=732165 RepID=UPI00044130A7|nr:uncharacterized protein DICSQDRAFT_151820 [Dichomitus squalens LYAD-421 SS1]EJF65739.1 hypothetical protein DICSQDRAFT_151820 [Dichomitus squalens LYAD-421 SS1]